MVKIKPDLVLHFMVAYYSSLDGLRLFTFYRYLSYVLGYFPNFLTPNNTELLEAAAS